MKRLLLLLVFINVMQSVVAALPDKELVLNASDGTSTCAVKGIRRITFDNGVMFVDMKDGSQMSWYTELLASVMFGYFEPGQGTDIAGVVQVANFVLDGKMLRVDCCSLTKVQLCTCDGCVVYDGLCIGEFSFDLSTLPTGIYLLNLGGSNYKILNRWKSSF